MNARSIHLKIMLPSAILADLAGIECVAAETTEGSIGFLPRRLDCTAMLVPGILTYRAKGIDLYAAIDTGVLVKAGPEILICTRNGLLGSDLSALRVELEKRFLHVDEEERQMRTALARMERGFVKRFWELRHAT